MRMTKSFRQSAMVTSTMFMQIMFVLALLLLLSSCGGGGGGGNTAPVDTGPEDKTVTRVAINPGTALLTELGDSQPLQAEAYNAADELIPGVAFTWNSNDPATVSIDNDGVIVAENDVGSALITVQADGVQSAPALVVVAMPAINSILIDDDQVVGNYELVDPDAELDIGFLYRVTLTDDVAVEVGDILIASGDASVGGQVTSVEDQGDGTQVVTLEFIGLDGLFDKVSIDESFDLALLEQGIPDDVLEFYDFEIQPDNSYLFTLKQPEATALNVQAAAVPLPVGPIGSTALSPWDCDGSTTPPFVLNALPTSISINPSLSLDFGYDRSMGGLQKLIVKGGVAADGKVESTITAALSAKYECKVELVAPVIPIGGAFSLLVSGRVPIGLGLSIEGKINLARVGFEAKAKASIQAQAGVDCTSGSCTGVAQITQKSLEPDFRSILPDPSALAGQLEFAPTVSAFGYADLALGPAVFRSIRFNAAGIKLGGSFAMNLGFAERQIGDPAYKSDYKITTDFSVGTGKDVDRLLRLFRVTTAKLELKFTDPLATSPQSSSFTLTESASAIGDPIRATLLLNPATVDFGVPPAAFYNVDKIIVYRSTGLGISRVTDVSASSGQTQFDLAWVAAVDADLDPATSYFAFTETTLLPTIATVGELELADVANAPPPPSSDVTGNWAGTWNAQGGFAGGLNAVLLLTANSLSGTATATGAPPASCPPPCDGEVIGTLNGNQIVIGTGIAFRSADGVSVTFSGEVSADGNSMSGTHNYGGTWQMTRQ